MLYNRHHEWHRQQVGSTYSLSMHSNAWLTPVLLPPATKLGQGYIFTGVCHSVNRRVSARGGGGCLVETPPGRPLLRAVRILLECILVWNYESDADLFYPWNLISKLICLPPYYFQTRQYWMIWLTKHGRGYSRCLQSGNQ